MEGRLKEFVSHDTIEARRAFSFTETGTVIKVIYKRGKWFPAIDRVAALVDCADLSERGCN
jgi:hypothetical protein